MPPVGFEPTISAVAWGIFQNVPWGTAGKLLGTVRVPSDSLTVQKYESEICLEPRCPMVCVWFLLSFNSACQRWTSRSVGRNEDDELWVENSVQGSAIGLFCHTTMGRLFEEMHSYSENYGGFMSVWNVGKSGPDRTVPCFRRQQSLFQPTWEWGELVENRQAYSTGVQICSPMKHTCVPISSSLDCMCTVGFSVFKQDRHFRRNDQPRGLVVRVSAY